MSEVRGRVLSSGRAQAPALVLDEPLSLWGGFDPATGQLIEARHPQHGSSLAGKVVVMPAARGSSSSSSVLAEAARAGVAPAALLLGEPDLILAIGAEVALELYGVHIPVLAFAPGELSDIRDGTTLVVHHDGRVAPV